MGTDYVKQSVSGGFDTTATINQNFTDLETALGRSLNTYGDSTTGTNSMQVSLDMNSNRVINATDAANASDLVTKRQLDAYASAALGSVDSSVVTYTPGETSAVDTTVQDKLREYVSFGDYAPNANGSTDDSALLQTALDENDELFIPAGNYKLDADVYVKGRGKVFLGAGVANTIFTVAAGVGGITVGNDATSNVTNHNMDVGGFKVTGGTYGVTLGGNGTGSKAMLGRLHDVLITGASVAGLRLTAPQGTSIENVICESNAIGCISDDDQAGTNTTFNSSCRFASNTSHGCLLKQAWGFTFEGRTGFESNGGWGLYLEKNTPAIANVTVHDCWFESNTTGSIFSDNAAIANLAICFNEFNTHAASPDPHLNLTCDSVVIIGNRFTTPTTNAITLVGVNMSHYIARNTGTVTTIPTGGVGFVEESGVITTSTIAADTVTLTAGQGVDALSVTTGNIDVTDGTIYVDNTTDTTDGDTITRSLTAGNSFLSTVRLNCGADTARVGLKFTINGIISSYMWMDDTGAPRYKTSLPTSDTDGTAM